MIALVPDLETGRERRIEVTDTGARRSLSTSLLHRRGGELCGSTGARVPTRSHRDGALEGTCLGCGKRVRVVRWTLARVIVRGEGPRWIGVSRLRAGEGES